MSVMPKNDSRTPSAVRKPLAWLNSQNMYIYGLVTAVIAYAFTTWSKRGYQKGIAAVYIAHLWEIALIFMIRSL